MRIEGTVVGSVCVSVTLHLTSRMFVRLTKHTYLTGNEGKTFRTVFSEKAALPRAQKSQYANTQRTGWLTTV